MEPTKTSQRETAKICTVKELINGSYVVQEGWLPNYINSNGRKLSRVNIIGIVVSKSNPFDFFIDDGTGSIQIIDFNQQKKVSKLKIGEPILLIGRPRQNDSTTFIACEIVNTKQLVEESSWVSYRKLELKQLQINPIKELNQSTNEISLIKELKKETPLPEKVELVTADVTGDDILSFIKKKDVGEGCLVEDIISYFGNDIDDHILTLITMGEVYEIKPGRIKVLE